MEPAAERREHTDLGKARIIDGPAAMEPAVGRREHLYWSGRTTSWPWVPQWSPPLNGGSTIAQAHVALLKFQPQWSPPLNGGSTALDLLGPVRRSRAAMEPAVERREHTAGHRA